MALRGIHLGPATAFAVVEANARGLVFGRGFN